MKLCIDCQFHKRRKCYSPHLDVDPVDGSVNYSYCSIEREGESRFSCGKDAKFFLQKTDKKRSIFDTWLRGIFMIR